MQIIKSVALHILSSIYLIHVYLENKCNAVPTQQVNQLQHQFGSVSVSVDNYREFDAFLDRN